MADGTAFAVDLEYFFLKTDEMLEKYMDQSAANACDCGMVATALVSLACLLTGWKEAGEALMTGLASGCAVAVMVYAVSTAFYGLQEKMGAEG